MLRDSLVAAALGSLLLTDGATAKLSLRTRQALSVPSRPSLARRDECTTVQVESGDGCASLAEKCGISGDDFESYNTDSDLCSTLVPYQYVCCSEGDLPDYSPQANEDGSCATYTTVSGDSCSTIAASNSLTTDDLEDFNEDTWGWNGCDNLWAGVKMCLSNGTAPFPNELENAVCGPQVPGTEAPDDDTDISTLNPCPLNACCDVWGQCGVTDEFCTDTSTGAPGTAANGTNGCISNCGTDIVTDDSESQWFTVGYFEGYNMGRDCVNMDASQIDTDTYTHIHFAFATFDEDWEVQMGDDDQQDQFDIFKELTGIKKILSFGGWDFSTSTDTYNLFREGTNEDNRLTLATNIANYVSDNDLDGVDIDWEYPGATDIPDIPAGDDDEGDNYLAFLVILKNLLGDDKTLSIACPSSYWYLKTFPIDDMNDVVDYFIFMTYDLHGQWDYDNEWSQPGCEDGNCLRSHVNLTETMTSLAMITKAGASSYKVIAGVSSYGRAFEMTDSSCYTAECTYVDDSATPGRCTNTSGYISDAEIKELADGDDATSYFDDDSQTDILVYDSVQWVAYMSSDTKDTRKTLYKQLGLGGTTDWAIDLEDFMEDDSAFPALARKKVGNVLDKGECSDGGLYEFMCHTCENADDREIVSLAQSPYDMWENSNASTALALFQTWWVDAKADGKKGSLTTWAMAMAYFFDSTKDITCTVGGAENYNCWSDASCDNTQIPIAGYVIMTSYLRMFRFYEAWWNALDNIQSSWGSFSDDFIDTFVPDVDNIQDTLNEWLVSTILDSVTGQMWEKFAKKLSLPEDSDLTEVVQSQYDDATGDAKDKLLELMSSDSSDDDEEADISSIANEIIQAQKDTVVDYTDWIFGGSEWDFFDKQVIHGTWMQFDNSSEEDIRMRVKKMVLAQMIPYAWQYDGKVVPVIAVSNTEEDTSNPFTEDGRKLSSDGVASSRVYLDGKTFWLVGMKPCQTWSLRYGCETGKWTLLDGYGDLEEGTDTWGNLNMTEMITSAWGGYKLNGYANGYNISDDDSAKSNLDGTGSTSAYDFVNGVMTPGFVSIPVCTTKLASLNWEVVEDGNEDRYRCDNYPCCTCSELGKSGCDDGYDIDE